MLEASCGLDPKPPMMMLMQKTWVESGGKNHWFLNLKAKKSDDAENGELLVF